MWLRVGTSVWRAQGVKAGELQVQRDSQDGLFSMELQTVRQMTGIINLHLP
jgi:hypothetical protein